MKIQWRHRYCEGWFGITISRGRGVYVWKGGIPLPRKVQQIILTVWNRIACQVLGHEPCVPECCGGECINCGARLR